MELAKIVKTELLSMTARLDKQRDGVTHVIDADQMLNITVEEIMIPATKVAYVSPENSLEHALLVLTGSGYSAIPVLDKGLAAKGFVNTTMILRAVADIEGYDMDNLGKLSVNSVMSSDTPKLKRSQMFLNALKQFINWPFVCVEDEEGKFVGILTRKAILSLLYRWLREESSHRHKPDWN